MMDSQKGTSQTWIKCRNFFGTPKRKDFKNVCQDLPDIQKGEILVEALCWTVDNYMTAFNVPEGSIMIGEQVASVIETLHEDYPLRMLVICDVGWRTRTIINPDKQLVRRLADIGSLPASLYLGTLGLPGLCAYFTTCEVFQVKAGDVLVINAASSPISNVVGQIAKIKDRKNGVTGFESWALIVSSTLTLSESHQLCRELPPKAWTSILIVLGLHLQKKFLRMSTVWELFVFADTLALMGIASVQIPTILFSPENVKSLVHQSWTTQPDLKRRKSNCWIGSIWENLSSENCFSMALKNCPRRWLQCMT
uniref:15-oxoprostaglandin 13-reductase n=1 Tax=Biomphalaria glabrata TaxID=6526 RepID=A0A2C9LIP7_BIOGL